MLTVVPTFEGRNKLYCYTYHGPNMLANILFGFVKDEERGVDDGRFRHYRASEPFSHVVSFHGAIDAKFPTIIAAIDMYVQGCWTVHVERLSPQMVTITDLTDAASPPTWGMIDWPRHRFDFSFEDQSDAVMFRMATAPLARVN